MLLSCSDREGGQVPIQAGVITGAIIGVVLGLLVLIVVIYYLMRFLVARRVFSLNVSKHGKKKKEGSQQRQASFLLLLSLPLHSLPSTILLPFFLLSHTCIQSATTNATDRLAVIIRRHFGKITIAFSDCSESSGSGSVLSKAVFISSLWKRSQHDMLS
ncbi:hypothetical protein ILYODFUR_033415 [Ilyodon furcidens]|uniref:Uncharacterized protein n=1 Tax=Ilyodon furcidens TaxID=33524 RepID=A0ABV0UAI6_9TELE